MLFILRAVFPVSRFCRKRSATPSARIICERNRRGDLCCQKTYSFAIRYRNFCCLRHHFSFARRADDERRRKGYTERFENFIRSFLPHYYQQKRFLRYRRCLIRLVTGSNPSGTGLHACWNRPPRQKRRWKNAPVPEKLSVR